LKSYFRWEDSNLILNTDGFPDLLPTAKASDTAIKKGDGPEKEEELGFFWFSRDWRTSPICWLAGERQ